MRGAYDDPLGNGKHTTTRSDDLEILSRRSRCWNQTHLLVIIIDLFIGHM